MSDKTNLVSQIPVAIRQCFAIFQNAGKSWPIISRVWLAARRIWSVDGEENKKAGW
jgi:hypothetical protein